MQMDVSGGLRMASGTRRVTLGYLTGRLLTALGGVLLASSTPAVALERRPVPPAGSALSETVPPWDRPGGSMHSPPRPPRRPMPSKERGLAHPALHGRMTEDGVVARLFPRASVPLTEERRAAMDRHPAGKALTRTTYRVRPGDSLWKIAATRVAPRDVARCTGALYRDNAEVVGPNENLILPDQILTIPDDCRG